MGKSTIIKALKLEYPAEVKVSNDGTSRIIAPVVTLDTPARATERMLRENMLFALTKEPRIAAAYAKERLLALDRLKYHGVKAFAIDNCHRFYNNGFRGRTGIRDFLCEFSEEGFSFILLGAPNMSKWLKDDEHLRTRMTRRFVIQRFTLGRQYERFLDAVELNLPLRRPSQLSTFLTSEFWEVTGGSIGETIELARRCCLLAIGSSEERITRPILERVVSR
jgi:Bacterial TniB protein